MLLTRKKLVPVKESILRKKKTRVYFLKTSLQVFKEAALCGCALLHYKVCDCELVLNCLLKMLIGK